MITNMLQLHDDHPHQQHPFSLLPPNLLPLQQPHVCLSDLQAPLAQVCAAAVCERPHCCHLLATGGLRSQAALVVVVQRMRSLNLSC